MNYKGKDVHVFVEGNPAVCNYDGKPKLGFAEALMSLLEKSPTQIEKPQGGEGSAVQLEMRSPKDKNFEIQPKVK